MLPDALGQIDALLSIGHEGAQGRWIGFSRRRRHDDHERIEQQWHDDMTGELIAFQAVDLYRQLAWRGAYEIELRPAILGADIDPRQIGIGLGEAVRADG